MKLKCTRINTYKVSVFGVMLVHIFLCSDWIRRDMEYLSLFSPNAGKCCPEELWIRTLFTQWITVKCNWHTNSFDLELFHILMKYRHIREMENQWSSCRSLSFSLLILTQNKWIIWFLLPLKSAENLWFFNYFRGNRN